MSGSFDAYYQWLGVPPAEQPPHHYRLLGLALYEASPDVISAAADRQMAFVQTHKLGPQSDASQKLLNELAGARRTLLDPSKKAAYDAELKRKLAPAPPPPGDAPFDPFASPGPFPHPSGPTNAASPALGFPVATPILVAAPLPGAKTARPPAGAPLLAIAGGVIGVLAGLLIAFQLVGRSAPPVRAAVDPSPEPPRPAATKPTPEPTSPPSRAVAPVATAEPTSAPAPVATAESSETVGTTSASPRFTPIVAPAPAVPDVDGSRPAPSPVEPSASVAAGEALPFDPLLDDPFANSAAPARAPIPSGDALATARAKVREVFGERMDAATERHVKAALAKEMFEPVKRGEPDPAVAYALMEASWRAAEEARDAWFACMVIDQAAKRFELDPIAMKAGVLGNVAPTAGRPEHHAFFAEAWLKLVDEAIAAGEYAAARTFTDRADVSARGAGGKELVERVQQAQNDAAALAREFEQVEPAKLAFEENPADAAAATRWGRFLCLARQDFARGLPVAAKGEGPLASVAREELTRPGDSAARLRVADAWRAIAESESDERAKKSAVRRAVGWYEKALGETSGLARMQIEKRLAEAEALSPPLPFGEWIDLKPYLNFARGGRWTKRGDLVGVFGDSQWDKIPVRVTPEGSYQVRAKLSIAGGDDMIAMRLPVGPRFVTAMLVGRSKQHALRGATNDPLPGSDWTSPARLPDGREVVFEAAVVVKGGRATVTGTLEGRRVMRWEGPLEALPLFEPGGRREPCLRVENGTKPATLSELKLRLDDGRVRLHEP